MKARARQGFAPPPPRAVSVNYPGSSVGDSARQSRKTIAGAPHRDAASGRRREIEAFAKLTAHYAPGERPGLGTAQMGSAGPASILGRETRYSGLRQVEPCGCKWVV